ncbi:MAG: hypothetical protein KGS73_08050 [Chloroflexi bacterium]|nr:hypothetical protein [Chloroflexota bacterium]
MIRRGVWRAILWGCGWAFWWWMPVAAQHSPAVPYTPNVDKELVYIDSAGILRIVDPQVPPYLPPVSFHSPLEDGSWYDAAVDDFNGDGDEEIVAVAEGGTLMLYDPVVSAGGVVPEQKIGGLYWDRLYRTELGGKPRQITTGEFDDNLLTRELVVVYALPDQPDASRIQILAQPAPPYDGRLWQVLTEVEMDARPIDLAAGDLDGDGRDELALVSEEAEGVRLSVYRRAANNALVEFWHVTSQDRPWTGVAIGNVAVDTAQAELVAVRSAAPPLPSLVVLRYRPVDAFDDVWLAAHLPAPRAVFLADATGGGVPQIFLLRDVPVNQSAPRLFNSRLGAGNSFAFEVTLGGVNAYRTLAAGDLDGDGREELTVLRDIAYRIYNDPAYTTTDYVSATVSSNQRTLLAGNLDALGQDALAFVPPAGTNPPQLKLSVPAGEPPSVWTTGQIQFFNRTRTQAIDFALHATVPFVAVAPERATTPATVGVTVDASDLLPFAVQGGALLPGAALTPTYGANLVATALEPLVYNSPLTLPVVIEVTPGVVVRPNWLDVVLQEQTVGDSCLPALPLTATIRLLGTAGSVVTVQSGASWLAFPDTAIDVPGVLEATILPEALAGSNTAQAEVILAASVPGATQQLRRVTLRVRCYSELLYLPLVGR